MLKIVEGSDPENWEKKNYILIYTTLPTILNYRKFHRSYGTYQYVFIDSQSVWLNFVSMIWNKIIG